MRKALFNAAGWLLPVLVALVATPWLIRELGAPRYGVWALCVLLGAVLPTLDLGFGVASIRELAGARADAARLRQVNSELVSVALVLAAAWWLAIALSSGAIADWLNFDQAVSPGEAKRLLSLLGPWVAIAMVNGALTALPRALERFGELAMLGTLSSLTLWSGAVVLAASGSGLVQLMLYGIVLQLVLCTALAALHRLIVRHWPRPTMRFRVLHRTTGFAFASFAGAVTSLATYHADKALVSAFLGPAAAGLYTASGNVANKLLGLVAALAATIYPRVSTLHAGGDSPRVAHLYLVSSRMLMTLTIALGTIGVVLAERFLTLWLGPSASQDLVLAFRLLIVAYVVASASVVASNVLSGRGNAHRGAWFAALGGGVTVLAALVLIPRLGLAGAGLAGLLGMSQALAFDLWIERELQAEHPDIAMSLRRPWTGWLIAGTVSGLVAWASVERLPGWWGLVASGTLALGAWAAVWFAGGLASPEERQLGARLTRAITDRGNDRKGT